MTATQNIIEWDRLWGAYVHALQTKDAALLADARRAMADFDKRHGLKPMVLP